MLSDISVTREKVLTILVTSLFVLFVVMLPRYTDTAKTWFLLLILLALGYLILNLGQSRYSSFTERVFCAAIVANFLWIVFSFYANGEPGRGASFVWGRHFYFLFVIPLFFIFRRVEIPDRIIVGSLICSVVVSLTDILIDIFQGIDHRLQGMNPNAFGPIQLCLSGILFFYFLKRPETVLRYLALAGAILGIATVIFSKSRNTWVTLIILCIFFTLYLTRSQPVWKKTALVVVIMTLISGSYLLPMVKSRVDTSIVNISNYFATDDYRDVSRLNPVGVRMELWKTGWNIFLENPMLGVGVGGFKPAAKANSEQYQVNEIVHEFKYVHNQYIAALATRGVPGLILFLLVLLVPVYIAMSQKAFARDSEVSQLAILFICMVYLIGCLAEDHFEGKSATMFVAVSLALFLARISAGKAQQKKEFSG